MSSKIVINEIARFLKEPGAEVLCIQGRWGVGKTFVWKKYFDQAREANKLAYEKYAYISLFGINSLSDLKQSIFENTYEEDFKKDSNLNSSLAKGLTWIKKIVLRSDVLSGYLGGIDRLVFLLVRNQTICIDDIERAGKDLSVNDILGLISFLKTERNCKVVILMNNEELDEENAKIFEKQKEKVTDVVLTFAPDAQEAAEIVFPSPSGTQEKIRDNVVLLGIINIRVIKKIEHNCARLLEALVKYPELHFQAVHSICLFTWSILQPSEAPPIDFIKEFRRYRLKDQKDTEDNEKKWGSLLSGYNYFHTDELDLLIIEGIKRGYFGGEEFDKTLETLGKAALRNQRSNSISKAWDKFNGSFDHNETEVLDGLYEANLENADVLTPANLNSVVEVLKEFGRDEQATKLINDFVTIHASEKEVFDLKRCSFREDVSDEEIVDAFNKQLSTFVDPRDPGKLLVDIVKNHGWNPEDIELLQKLSADDFYTLFKSRKDDELFQVVAGALQFLRIQDIPEETKDISHKAVEALKQIGKENRLNKRRVVSYGIKLDE